jgi:hypothetical protein
VPTFNEPERKGTPKNYIHLNIKMPYGIVFDFKNKYLKCTWKRKTNYIYKPETS